MGETNKGRTIRKVMGVGGGGGGGAEFSSSVNFFFLMFPLNDLFFCQDDVHEYFFPLK